MQDVRVDRSSLLPPIGVPGAAEERRQERRDGGQRRPSDERPGGREELALALDEPGRALRAELEQDAHGELRVRVVDRARGEVVAVLSPEELRELAEQTGLPSGLLFQARS